MPPKFRPPPWIGRSPWQLLLEAMGGWAQNKAKLMRLGHMVLCYLGHPIVLRRIKRLRELNLIDTSPTVSQMLIAGRDQILLTASDETKVFYERQGIPWNFHNFRRFVADPTSMMDPVGIFSHRDTLVHHVLQTFHRHPVYDMGMLRVHAQGLETLQVTLEQVQAGTHLEARALNSLVEDPDYHPRLKEQLEAFIKDPTIPALPLPEDQSEHAHMMLAMDQFKDLMGFARYASRLKAGPVEVLVAVGEFVFNLTLGKLLGKKLGPQRIQPELCDEELRKRYQGSGPSGSP